MCRQPENRSRYAIHASAMTVDDDMRKLILFRDAKGQRLMSPSSDRAGAVPDRVLEFRGRMMSLTVLQVLSLDVDAVAAALAERCRSAPQLFRNLPVLIDLEACGAGGDLTALLACVRRAGLLPIGVRGDAAIWREAADHAAISFFAIDAGRTDPAPLAERPDAAAAPEPRPDSPSETAGETASRDAGSRPNLLVEHPVRSGQQVYSPAGDLVIVGDVGAGAEVLARGNVHIYGTLRGRALAGVHGDRQARIFCRRFDAEMVSVAGVYAVTDQFGRDVVNQPALISLEAGAERLAIKRF